ncbi:MAG TPA: cytochrome c3 family protein [Pseudomonadales bacterium]|nr:cytochrome c3 family protein [Pseudomonadales bacterium]
MGSMDRAAGMLLVLALLCLTAAAADAAAPCALCHAGPAASFGATPHGHALADLATESTADAACVACHGDGTAHMADPLSATAIRRFDEADAADDDTCEQCHADTHTPASNAHARAGLACTNCHGIHAPQAMPALPGDFGTIDAGSATCFACHQQTFTEFQLNERHRLAEGALACADCHDPHAPTGGLRLGAFREAVCGECHVDATGPFVFEHAASTVEGCSACHVPHGSPNRHLLTHQREGELCYGCHALVPQFHLGFSPAGAPRFDENTQCTNCHVTIHGSNLDPFFLR